MQGSEKKTEHQLNTEGVQKGTRRKSRSRHNKQMISYILLILLWGALVFSGYWYIESRLTQQQEALTAHVNTKIQEVKETNALNVQQLKDKLENVRTEVDELQNALESADESLSSSVSARQQINNKISELDARLKELKTTLEILKEEADADN